MSISPESSAATRVAALPMTLNSARSILCSGLAQLDRQDRVDPVGREIDRQLVDLGRLLDRRDLAALGRVFRGDALEREDDVVGGEICPVLPFDAGPKVKAPGIGSRRFPARRQ